MITLYGVTWAGTAPPVQDVHLIWSDDRELVLIGGDAPVTTDRSAALDYGRTVERVAAEVDVLPFRYGTTVEDTGAARKLLFEHAGRWAARLSVVAGCVELAVRVSVTSDSAGATGTAGTSGRSGTSERGTGAEHLRRLVARSQGLDAAEQALRGLLADSVRDVRRLPGHEQLRLSCLVERADSTAVRREVESWASDRPDLEVSVTGPWAPYSFAADDQEVTHDG